MTRTIGVVTRVKPGDTLTRGQVRLAHHGRPPEGSRVFNRKQPQDEDVDHADLIDLLLDADEHTRRLIMNQVVQAGVLNKSEADTLIAHVLRLERVAGPRQTAPKPEPETRLAWGIDYP
jgi:hypothetical protein